MIKSLRKIVCVVFILFPVIIWASPIQMSGMKIEPGKNRTRLIFNLSDKTFGKIKYIPSPPRVMILFANTNMRFKISNVNVSGANIRTISAKQMYGTIQFIMQVTGKVHWTAQFIPNGERVNFQVDIVSAAGNTKEPVLKPIQHKQQDPQTFSSTLKNPMFIVAIDAGHGGKDTGAIGQGGEREKNVVLAIAKKLAIDINRQPGMRAILTRNGDYYIPLRGRLNAARKAKADLFIAIHADGFFDDRAKGASVYAISQHGATSEAARWLAQKENYSELGNVSLNNLQDHSPVLRSVLIDMAQTATTQDSLNVGKEVLAQLDDISTLHYKRVEQAPFMVLKSPDIPSILIETGFISNPSEASKLMNAKYQEQLASAIKTGIQQYIRKSY